MTEIQCPSFTENVVCEMDTEYKIAQGWTQSTGQGGSFPYTVPTGWEFDARYSDIRGPSLGSHGGCPNCIMTLVHLITIEPVVVDPCEDVVCEPTCFGVDRYSTTCVGGVCIKGILITADVPECGYVAPEPEHDPATSWMLVIIIFALALAWVLGILG